MARSKYRKAPLIGMGSESKSKIKRRYDLKTRRPKRKTLSFKCFKTLELLRSSLAATAKQIQREAFSDCSLSFVYRKMRDLEREKWIAKIPFLLEGNRSTAYTLSGRGWRLFDSGEFCPSFAEQAQMSWPLHKTGLLDIRHAFGQREEVENYYPRPYYTNHRDLEGFLPPCPDAIVELKKDGESVFYALEYFADFYCPEGTEAKIERYNGHEKLAGAIFISYFRHVTNRLMALERGRSPSKIYHAGIGEVLSAKDKMEFTSRDNASLLIA